MRLPQSIALPFRLISAFIVVTLSSLLAFGSHGGYQQLRSTPRNLAFGAVEVSQSLTQTVTLTNTGKTSTTVSSLVASNPAFSVSGLALPATLAAGQSATVSVTFAPGTAGWITDNITVTTAASTSSLQIGLQGNAVKKDPLSAAPSSLSFGQVAVGSKSTLPVVVTNSQYGKVIVTSYQTSGNGFSVSGPSLPLTLSQGQSATLNATFSPGVSGLVNGSVLLAGPGLLVAFTGTGAATTGQLSSNPSTLSFGTVTVGSNQSFSGTITNTGSSSISVSNVSISGAAFTLSGINSSFTLGAGQSTTFNVKFAPTTTGNASGSVTVTSNASNPTMTVPLSGTGAATAGQLGSSPASLNFGSVTVGSNESLSGTITNTGGSSVSVSNVQIGGTGFSLSGINSSFTLSAGQSATFTVKFAPTSTGTASGSVTVTSNASDPTLTTSLSGTGTATAGQLTVSPSSLGFGNVDVGSTTTQTSTISASGGSVTVSSAASSNAQYAISGASFPLTLNSGQSAQLTVSFAPTKSGSSTATLTYTTSTSVKSSESASGTGVSPQYTVNLSWNPSTSSVSGYNVYRGTTSGVYTKINSSLDPGTSYADGTVVAGTTYYYAATSVNSSGQESTYSTPIQVAVP